MIPFLKFGDLGTITVQMSTKVRLVRCPKCRQVLAELPEVPLYKCGGCGTILQAKNRKVEINGAALSLQETGSVAKSQQDNDLEDEARSSNHDSSSPPKVESSRDKDEHGDCSMELCNDRSVSECLSSSPEVTSRQNEDSPVEVKESLKHDDPLGQSSKRYDSKFHVENQDNEVDRMEGGESERVLPEHENQESVLHSDSENTEGIKSNYVPPESDEKSRIRFTDKNGVHGGHKHENENTSKSMEQSINASGSASVIASQSPLNGSLVSFYLSSSDDEHLDHSPNEGTRNFERVSSIDTLGSSPLADVISELNLKHRSMTRYPSYYAHDGSESSYDGTNDQILEHISHPSRKSKIVDYNSSTEMLRKDRFRVNNTVNSEPERIYWASSGNRFKEGGVSTLPFTSRDPLASHRTVSYPSHERNLLPPRPGFSSSDKHSYSEPDNMDLLRTVCELKDQLDRMHFPKVTTNRRFPAGVVEGKFTHYYDHFAPENGYNPRSNISRLAFSGEASHYRHHVRCSCLHCSAQLPSHSIHRENGHRVVHTDQNYCNISSSLSSEQSLWGCEAKADKQMHDEIKWLHLKEKHHTAKRHLRPIAGGAPVVACYHCSEILQLPADFLLFKKRYHQLMCNACKKVMKFSLVKGTHIVPYLPDASAPPPSEADDYNDATSQRKPDPLSHSVSCQNAESVSYSDEYGLSFGRSCSTEGETSVTLPSFDQVGRKMSSGSSYEDRKMKSILKETENKKESSLKTVESAESSSKMPKWRKTISEIEEVPSSSNSPLHQLMGYSSPRHVLNN